MLTGVSFSQEIKQAHDDIVKEAKEIPNDIPDVYDDGAQLELKNAAGDVSEGFPAALVTFRVSDMTPPSTGRDCRQQAHCICHREARDLEREEGAGKDYQQGHLDEQRCS